jgi:hypothetical protein
MRRYHTSLRTEISDLRLRRNFISRLRRAGAWDRRFVKLHAYGQDPALYIHSHVTLISIEWRHLRIACKRAHAIMLQGGPQSVRRFIQLSREVPMSSNYKGKTQGYSRLGC